MNITEVSYRRGVVCGVCKRMTENATPQPAIPPQVRMKKRRLNWGKSCTEKMQITTAFHVESVVRGLTRAW